MRERMFTPFAGMLAMAAVGTRVAMEKDLRTSTTDKPQVMPEKSRQVRRAEKRKADKYRDRRGY